MLFKRIELPYEFDDLEPYMSKEQIYYHYSKHHLAYEIATNNILRDIILPSSVKTLEDLMTDYTSLPKKYHVLIRNMGGGLINHNLFFSILGKNKCLSDERFINDINRTFGGFDILKNQLIRQSLEIFGSGWSWLVIDKENNLKIVSTYNQDNPWFLNFKPLIGIDVWEHAYYIDYRNEREKYVKNIFSVLNWEVITDLYLSYKNESIE